MCVTGKLEPNARRTPEMELIAQSKSSREPDGAHMVDLVRALLNGPIESAASEASPA